MHSAGLFDLLLVSFALGLQIGRIAIQDVHILRHDVDVLEEVVPHEIVVRFGVVARQAHVLVHVERFHVAERDAALLVEFDQLAIHAQRRAS